MTDYNTEYQTQAEGDSSPPVMYYAPSTGGFYTVEIHGNSMPPDIVALPDGYHDALLDGQSSGLRIMPPDGEHSLPWLAAPPPPTEAELANDVRRQRNNLLAATDYLMTSDYPLTDDERAVWTAYRRALRDITAQDGFPSSVIWPDWPSAS